jgi:hypothetical protein
MQLFLIPGIFCWWPVSSHNHHCSIYCLDELPEHMLAHNTDVVYRTEASEIQCLPSAPLHLSLSPSVFDVLMLIAAPFGTDPHPAKCLLWECNKTICTAYLATSTSILYLQDIVEALTLPTLVSSSVGRTAAITLPTILCAIAAQTLSTTF